jgi:O-acetyl-ADP-ribose deacetylase
VKISERLHLIVADITTLDVDAIVNAANEGLRRGAGVCGAIFRAAGPRLDGACAALAPCPTGEARLTSGFDGKARWIVHAVGPVWHGGSAGEPALLATAYRAALDLAAAAGARSIAFPAISTGIYGFPLDRAAEIAITTVERWSEEAAQPHDVFFCMFSQADADIYQASDAGGRAIRERRLVIH